ncbi:unnamed protein product [Dicrocoelium dendriticum]|nr:unnamed protein product [Dicrocoelium dendriticum]
MEAHPSEVPYEAISETRFTSEQNSKSSNSQRPPNASENKVSGKTLMSDIPVENRFTNTRKHSAEQQYDSSSSESNKSHGSRQHIRKMEKHSNAGEPDFEIFTPDGLLTDQEDGSSDSEIGDIARTPSTRDYGQSKSRGSKELLNVESEQSRSGSPGNSTVRKEEARRDREELVEQYRQAVLEHKIARETNLQLQTKLAEYFRRKKADAADQQSGASSVGGSMTDNAVDYEQRYNKYITSLTELRSQYQTMQASYHKQIEELKNTCSERQKEVDEAYKDFTTYKFNVGKKALHSKTGRPINTKELMTMLNAEQKKEATVMEVRLENIKLKNEVAKVEAILKSKEELAEGLHLIDFEQLKIENQTYNEKIEERNEELAKLKRKIANTVQIMAHVKEKLQAVQSENAKQRQRLGIADAELTFNRDQLTRLKHARDQLRSDNAKLRRSCGLLGKTTLLLNFEDSVDAVSSKLASLEETKKMTSHYLSKARGLRNKIESHPERQAALNKL